MVGELQEVTNGWAPLILQSGVLPYIPGGKMKKVYIKPSIKGLGLLRSVTKHVFSLSGFIARWENDKD